MRFIDEATIKVAGGHGGPGSVSFRREKFIPRGGPDGGDGGAGGEVIFISTVQLGTLQDFRFKREYKAEAGMHGSGSGKTGRDGETVRILVPLGTVIKDAETGEVLIDMSEDKMEWVACKGGRGGKGNAHFVTSVHQAPKYAQPGEEGENRSLKLELKLLADVAIVGFPNAGKSTLISRISAARPKIADYAFTTLTPNLGVVALPDFTSFVVADIPGLIEGAHRGMGLGHKFLKHIERTRMFIHLIDGAQFLEEATRPDIEDSFEQALDQLLKRYLTIREELRLFDESLSHKREIVVFNKVDLIESDPELVERARKRLRDALAQARGTHPEAGEPWIISGVSGAGINDLLKHVAKFVVEHRISSHESARHTETKLPDDEDIRR